MRDALIAVTRNPLSLLGAAVTTASGILILVLFGIGLLGYHGGAYSGILTYLVLPGVFAAGLVLMPFGAWWERRRRRRAAARGEAPAAFPVIDLNRDRVRRFALLFVAATALNIAILSLATYKGVHEMESVAFCGTTCHTVMQPEYTTYQRSPHARVACVSCHIGPGADWFVKSKLSGSWQLVSVALDLYPRPIPTPVHNLRPARETCEQCHWPTKFVGDRLRVFTHYADDAPNSETKSVVLLRVGGVEGRKAHGIHWHVDPGIRIRYRADVTRASIQEVELTSQDGTSKLFRAADQGGATEAEWRVMDCIDCHNRPSHIYRTAAHELDTALREGRIDRSLPFVKRQGLKLLAESYASHVEARAEIPLGLARFYAAEHPEVASAQAAAVAAAGAALAEIWCWNVFPDMNVTWGTYPNHIGHQDYPGCFRCHDDLHTTADGEAISQDCTTCHTLLAVEEANPEILQQLNP
jgi:hypothetical protein